MNTTRHQKLALLLLVVLPLLLGSLALSADTKGDKKAPNPADFAPETVTIEGLKNLYGPVMFTHKAHLGYAGDCGACHHHSPAGEYPACGQCHSAKEVKTAADKTIGLKGAYHRQCMDCHKAMGSGPMGCTDCHAKAKPPAPPAGQPTTPPATDETPKTGGK